MIILELFASLSLIYEPGVAMINASAISSKLYLWTKLQEAKN